MRERKTKNIMRSRGRLSFRRKGKKEKGDNREEHLVPHYMMRPWQHPHMELVAMEIVEGSPNLHKEISKTASLDKR